MILQTLHFFLLKTEENQIDQMRKKLEDYKIFQKRTSQKLKKNERIAKNNRESIAAKKSLNRKKQVSSINIFGDADDQSNDSDQFQIILEKAFESNLSKEISELKLSDNFEPKKSIGEASRNYNTGDANAHKIFEPNDFINVKIYDEYSSLYDEYMKNSKRRQKPNTFKFHPLDTPCIECRHNTCINFFNHLDRIRFVKSFLAMKYDEEKYCKILQKIDEELDFFHKFIGN